MTPDGLKLHGWHLKAKDKSRGTILQLHGNAENISTHVNSVLWLALEGYDVFNFDYRGYGKSEGSPTLDGVHIDARAALETVLKLLQGSGINFKTELKKLLPASHQLILKDFKNFNKNTIVKLNFISK